MSITTYSVFYYGYEINRSNNIINFNEGSGELVATISIGKYTATTLQTAIKTAMDAVGTLTYTVVFDRISREYTISSTANFDLLIDTGTQSGLAPFTLLGFTGSVDLTGQSSYTSDSPSGDIYEPQFVLQDYVEPDHFQESIDSNILESANGNIEAVSFGTRKFIEMNIKWITDILQDGKTIKNNPTGVADVVRFLENLKTKGQLEFMPDIDSRGNFFSVLVETLPNNSKGTGFRLTEELAINLPKYYQTGRIRFRVTD